MVNFKVATLMACVAGLAYGQVPDQCLKKAGPDTVVTVTPNGQLKSIDESVSSESNATSEFFGLRSCMDKVTDRLVSVQFYLKDDGSEDLKEMPQIGPTLDEDLVNCKRRKLEFDDYFVQKVVVYQSDIGVEAMRFDIPYKNTIINETFGTPSADAKEIEFDFTETSKLISISGDETFAGIKGVELSSLDTECVKVFAEVAIKQETYDTALKAIEGETNKA